jgi:hypothetical protein
MHGKGVRMNAGIRMSVDDVIAFTMYMSFPRKRDRDFDCILMKGAEALPIHLVIKTALVAMRQEGGFPAENGFLGMGLRREELDLYYWGCGGGAHHKRGAEYDNRKAEDKDNGCGLLRADVLEEDL